jgi:hypothetical protein
MIIVEIRWQDAETYGDNGWTPMEEAKTNAEKAPPVMNSVGYLMYEDHNYIAITDSIGPEETGHITKIPKGMILSRSNLESLP